MPSREGIKLHEQLSASGLTPQKGASMSQLQRSRLGPIAGTNQSTNWLSSASDSDDIIKDTTAHEEAIADGILLDT